MNKCLDENSPKEPKVKECANDVKSDAIKSCSALADNASKHNSGSLAQDSRMGYDGEKCGKIENSESNESNLNEEDIRESSSDEIEPVHVMQLLMDAAGGDDGWNNEDFNEVFRSTHVKQALMTEAAYSRFNFEIDDETSSKSISLEQLKETAENESSTEYYIAASQETIKIETSNNTGSSSSGYIATSEKSRKTEAVDGMHGKGCMCDKHKHKKGRKKRAAARKVRARTRRYR